MAVAHRISIASIRGILEEYDPKNLKEDESLLDDANTVAILCEIAASTEFFVTPSQQRQLLDLLWNSPFYFHAGSRHPFLIGKLASLMFYSKEEHGIRYLKDKKLKVDIHALYETTSFIPKVSRIIARLHRKYNNKNRYILFTNENYEKILTTLKKSSDDISFLNSLDALCQLLKSANMMNQSNLDLILDNSNALKNNLDSFVNNLNYIGGSFTPHILNFILKELHDQDQNKLSSFLSLFLNNSRKRNGPAPINSRFDYIVKHYRKIPDGLYPILQTIPRHLLSMNFFRQLIKIADKNITQAQKVLEMTAAITTLINSDAPGRGAVPQTINYGQSVHNSDVEKTVAESTFKLQAAYPDVYSGEMLESKLNELRQFATSLKKTTTEKFAQAAILRISNNPHDHQLLRAGMTNKQALALVWAALHDETKYLPGVTLEDAKKSFINALIGIERAYNIDEYDRDDGTESRESCISGTFNMIINALNTIHHDVHIAFNSKELAGLRLNERLLSRK